MPTSRAHDPWRIWLLALGYFAFYIPYSALTKALSLGRLPGMSGPVPGFLLLPATAVATTVVLLMFVTIGGGWGCLGPTAGLRPGGARGPCGDLDLGSGHGRHHRLDDAQLYVRRDLDPARPAVDEGRGADPRALRRSLARASGRRRLMGRARPQLSGTRHRPRGGGRLPDDPDRRIEHRGLSVGLLHSHPHHDRHRQVPRSLAQQEVFPRGDPGRGDRLDRGASLVRADGAR